MRKAQVWGGEPELLMSSHVLQLSQFSFANLSYDSSIYPVLRRQRYMTKYSLIF